VSLHDSQNTSSVCNYITGSNLEKHAEESIPSCALAEPPLSPAALVQRPASAAALTASPKQCEHQQQNPKCFNRLQRLEVLRGEAALFAFKASALQTAPAACPCKPH